MLEKLEGGQLHSMFLLFGDVVRALTMVTTEICAVRHTLRPASTIIPFRVLLWIHCQQYPIFYLNFSVVLILVVHNSHNGFL